MRKMSMPIKKISREIAISRNTVRRVLRNEYNQRYQRQEGKPTLLSGFMPFLMERTPQLGFNATTLHWELQKIGYTGGYTMVRMAVQPLRDNCRTIKNATARFETLPGLHGESGYV